MKSKNSFSNEAVKVLANAGWPNCTSESLLSDWKWFIDKCKKGYPENIYEYTNDIRIRERLEVLISSSELQHYDEICDYIDKVKELDNQFNELLQQDVKLSQFSYWWEQGILKYAHQELAKDYWDNYCINIQVVA